MLKRKNWQNNILQHLHLSTSISTKIFIIFLKMGNSAWHHHPELTVPHEGYKVRSWPTIDVKYGGSGGGYYIFINFWVVQNVSLKVKQTLPCTKEILRALLSWEVAIWTVWYYFILLFNQFCVLTRHAQARYYYHCKRILPHTLSSVALPVL